MAWAERVLAKALPRAPACGKNFASASASMGENARAVGNVRSGEDAWSGENVRLGADVRMGGNASAGEK